MSSTSSLKNRPEESATMRDLEKFPPAVDADADEPSFTAVEDVGETKPEGDFPDGGLQAWLVAGGAASAFFCTMGYTNAIGIFQAYYKQHQLSHKGEDDIAWIGSTQIFIIFFMGAFGGPLFERYGAWILRPAAVVYVFAIMMTSLCKNYWQFMLAQGILTGIASGLTCFPAMAAVPQWFGKKRGAAMGLTVAGASIGAVIFPILLSRLLIKTNIGFGWAVRISGFLMIPFLLFMTVAVKARLPPRKTRLFLLDAFKNPMYDLLILSLFCALIGMYVPLFLLPTYAMTKGMNPTLANYLVAISNGSSFFGRIIPGALGDKFGRVNAYIGAVATTAIMVFVWPRAESNASIIVIATLFGFASGAIVSGGSVTLTLCADKPQNMGTYMGLGIALASFSALVGPPVSGRLVDQYGGFTQVSYFCGAVTVFGFFVALLAKALSPVGLFRKI